MSRLRFWTTAVVKDDERAFLRRDGRFEKLLPPGRFMEFDPFGQLTIETVKVLRAEIAPERALLLAKTEPDIATENFVIVQPGPTEVAIVSMDGDAKHLVLPNSTRAFWKTLTAIDVELVDTAGSLRVDKRHLDKLDTARSGGAIVETVIEANHAGLLVVDGVLTERLAPGRHAFWSVGRTVRIVSMDLRPQPLEVTAQEILTKDRVGIRVTLTAFARIVDPEKAASAATDVNATLYRLIQFAIREAVATRTLDDILAARHTIDNEVRAYVTNRAGQLGAEIGEIGVKDVILPGDVRDLLNKVVEAERVAKANIIRRQEETAATRSLLNTSKLMENNPLLLRLKELEALEKLVEKVGRIDLHTGAGAGGFEALLSNLYKLGTEKAADGK
ncbi:MAG: slipin family protein [Hyphomicrobium zavarzinii]|jgi:regulator of protease activity HflC (stomatin/prohibitin superfamily)|uniref:slipin family protein n=1 Tax=Hyphomicrobium TaxID=81 RepID=UPI00035E2D36|nr:MULTISPECIES: slipin family protein [Hyphomicrobium]MBL8846319.1 slipin family protein [Hyphomicrobium zavarzinii]WBT38345.1 slipin family protein [Hyphomicrobium sp. DMF-1]HML41747.1 slipin family protein [Hyphomicrobium zavarzinii]